MDVRERIGNPLRRVRRERGLDLGDVASALGIPERYLADLEEGRFEAFGPTVHALCYVRVYARHLGVDPDAVLASVPEAAPAPPSTARRRGLLIAALALIGVGALVAIITVLVFDRNGETLNSVALDDGAVAGEPGDSDDTGVLPEAVEGESDETGVRSRTLEGSPAPTGSAAPETEPEADVGDADATAAGDAGEGAVGAVGEGLRVQLLDGAGDGARVDAARRALEDLGYTIVFVDLAAGPYEQTTVRHTEEFADAAAALLAADERFTARGPDPGLGAPADLHVVVGLDWPDA